MLYARRPTEQERLELERMTRQAVGRISQRARMILLSAQRRSVPKLAALFGMSPPTTRFWIHQFNAEGPQGLHGKRRYDHSALGQE